MKKMKAYDGWLEQGERWCNIVIYMCVTFHFCSDSNVHIKIVNTIWICTFQSSSTIHVLTYTLC